MIKQDIYLDNFFLNITAKYSVGCSIQNKNGTKPTKKLNILLYVYKYL